MVRFARIPLALAAACTLTASYAAPSIGAPSSDDLHFVALVRATLAQTPTHFAAYRGAVSGTSDNEAIYKTAGRLTALCEYCTLTDEFADTKVDERWVVQTHWTTGKSWTQAQTASHVQGLIAPLVVGFTRSEGGSDGSLWTDWFNKKTRAFVYISTDSEKGIAGFEIRIGRYMAKNVHYGKWSRPLTSGQRSDLVKALQNFVQMAVPNGANNFSALRGKAVGKSGDFFDSSVTFGDILSNCNVSAVAAASNVTGKWIFECETPAIVGTKSDVEELIRSTLWIALPGGFTSTTDPSLLINDYRWDRSSDQLALTLDAYDYGDGSFKYTISFYHFTS